jgi:hypothetical protein
MKFLVSSGTVIAQLQRSGDAEGNLFLYLKHSPVSKGRPKVAPLIE